MPARGVNHAAGKRCTVTGYGYMGECKFKLLIFKDKTNDNSLYSTAGPIPLRIREAEIPVVSDTECIRKVNAVTEKIFILPASSFCAGGEEGNDACQVSYYKLFCIQNKNKKFLHHREMEAVHLCAKTTVSMN